VGKASVKGVESRVIRPYMVIIDHLRGVGEASIDELLENLFPAERETRVTDDVSLMTCH